MKNAGGNKCRRLNIKYLQLPSKGWVSDILFNFEFEHDHFLLREQASELNVNPLKKFL